MKRQILIAGLAAGLLIGAALVALALLERRWRPTDEPGKTDAGRGDPVTGQADPSAETAPSVEPQHAEASPPSAGGRDSSGAAGGQASATRHLGFSLEGAVLDAGTGAPLPQTDLRVRLRKGNRTDTRQVRTDGQGKFMLRGLEAGEHDVAFEHPRYSPVETEIFLSPEKPVARFDVTFKQGIRVRGKVRSAEGGAPCAAILEWRQAEPPYRAREVATAPDGDYELGGLTPGRYRVRVVPSRFGAVWRKESAREVVVEPPGKTGEAGETAKAGESSRGPDPVTMDFDADLGAAISVLVRGADGRPAGGVAVKYVVTSEGRGVSGFLPPTGSDGRASICGLPDLGTLVLEVPPTDRGEARATLDLGTLPSEVELILENG